VFGCHGVSAVWGGIGTGCFASEDSGLNVTGLFYGNGSQFAYNVCGSVVSAAYAFSMTLLLLFLLGLVINPRVTEEEEHEGLDAAVHGEENDPLTEKDVINILRSMNNFSAVGDMLGKHASTHNLLKSES